MDNRILDAYDEFSKNTKEVATSGLFGFAHAFKAGVEAEKERIEKRIIRHIRSFNYAENEDAAKMISETIKTLLDRYIGEGE